MNANLLDDKGNRFSELKESYFLPLSEIDSQSSLDERETFPGLRGYSVLPVLVLNWGLLTVGYVLKVSKGRCKWGHPDTIPELPYVTPFSEEEFLTLKWKEAYFHPMNTGCHSFGHNPYVITKR